MINNKYKQTGVAVSGSKCFEQHLSNDSWCGVTF